MKKPLYRFGERFEKEGINRCRITFIPYSLSKEMHLRCYQELDIGLDPFPFGGHITTLESIWMGVPIIALEGKNAFGRASGSILHELKLDDLVATDEEKYINIAVSLAYNLPRLEELRRTLREQLRQSSFFDYKGYMQNVETLYRHVWYSWC